MDRGAWWAAVHGVTESLTQLADFHTHVRKEYKVFWEPSRGRPKQGKVQKLKRRGNI